jgi:hypothetical protein
MHDGVPLLAVEDVFEFEPPQARFLEHGLRDLVVLGRPLHDGVRQADVSGHRGNPSVRHNARGEQCGEMLVTADRQGLTAIKISDGQLPG